MKEKMAMVFGIGMEFAQVATGAMLGIGLLGLFVTFVIELF